MKKHKNSCLSNFSTFSNFSTLSIPTFPLDTAKKEVYTDVHTQESGYTH